MLSKKMEEALNDQLHFELYSSYIYFAMASYLDSLDLNGFTNWMQVQVKEELVHVMKFYTFINERNSRVVLQAVDNPGKDWESPLAVFQAALEHEQKVTARINNLINLALEEKDHATNHFLQWFVNEQVEEEASVNAVIQQLKLAGKEGPGLFMIDRELGTRVFVPPPATPAGA